MARSQSLQRSIRHRLGPLLSGALLGFSVGANAQSGYWPQADTSGWSCRLCPEQARLEGSVTGGVGAVSESSEKFGEYTGLDDSGAHLIAAADLTYRLDEGALLELNLENPTLGAPRLALSHSRQGHYRLSLDYERLPKFVAEDAETVFEQAGSQHLQLPNDWQAASSTRAMTQLLPSLDRVSLNSDRETFQLGASAQSGGQWHYGIDYRRIEQEGERLLGASFLTNSAILPAPLDRVTDQVDANIAYLNDSWQVQLAYHGSLFDNQAESVVWDNPYTPLGQGGDQGRMSQEPDNRFHQLLLFGSWQPLALFQTSGRLAVGQAQQNETFLPATINPTIDGIAQPSSDLNGQVDTFNSHGRILFTPLQTLTLSGELYYDERDNRTDQLLWLPVRSDLAPTEPRVNRPYSFERTGAKLRIDYKPQSSWALSAGSSREQTERDFQETEETGTTEYWSEVRASGESAWELRLRLGREDRGLIQNYQPLDNLSPPENPLLRRFHLAERDRDRARLQFSYSPVERVSLSVSLDYADDEYKAQIGLTDAQDFSQSIDVSATPKDDINLYAFFTRQVIESEQAGSERFATADWTGSLEDTIYTAGFGLEWANLREDLDLGMDYHHSNGEGKMRVVSRSSAPDFPDLSNAFNRLKLYGRYRLNPQVTLRLDYWYEKLETDNFFIDGVEPATIPNLLSLGQHSPDYSVHAVGISGRYRF